MSDKSTIFYRGNTAVSVDFSAEEISSDGAIVLLEKIERPSIAIGKAKLEKEKAAKAKDEESNAKAESDSNEAKS